MKIDGAIRKRDYEVGKIHDKYWDTEKQAAAQIAAVLLVEGDDDRTIVEELVKRRHHYWDQKLRIVAAGGRRKVIERMGPQSTFPTAYGLVDRDTWSDDDVAERQRGNGRIYVTEGWCIENIFLQPDFLQQYDAGIAAKVAAEREAWVSAGAFWWTAQRIREAQQSWQEALEWSKYYGTPHPNLDLSSSRNLVQTLTKRIPDAVCNELRLDFTAIAENFEKRLDYVLSLPEKRQWQIGVHGKFAFNKVLAPLLDAHHPPRNEEDSRKTWRQKLANHDALGRPAPFDELIAMLFP